MIDIKYSCYVIRSFFPHIFTCSTTSLLNTFFALALLYSKVMHCLGSQTTPLCSSHVCICSTDVIVLTLCLGLEGLWAGA